MIPTVKAILTVLSRAQLAGRGTLTTSDVETLERLAKSHDALLAILKRYVSGDEDDDAAEYLTKSGLYMDARAAITRAERDK